MIYLFSFLWLAATGKVLLFYLYLWQLKDYHIGRFIDHFRTEKGKRVLFGWLNGLKLLWLVAFYYGFDKKLLLAVLMLLYFVEFLLFLKNYFQKRVKNPVWTFKAVLLTILALIIELAILTTFLWISSNIYSLVFWLAMYNVAFPAFVAVLVITLQPLAFLIKLRTLLAATKKISRHKNLIVVGITGSYAKTTTKEFLAIILSQKFKVLKTKEHQNSEIGVSRCILKELEPEHQVFVCEMGAYGKGGIKLLTKIAQPRIGIITGINEQHLALFGSQKNIIETKFELINALPKNGLAIMNWDNDFVKSKISSFVPLSAELRKDKQNQAAMKFYSLTEKKDIWAENIREEKEFVTFKVVTRDGNSAEFRVNVLGRQNISNILAASLCAKELGMELKEVALACQKIKPSQGGMQIIKTEQGIDIIDASYSANSSGVMAALDHLKQWPGRKIMIMPCLIELWPASKRVHKAIGQKIAKTCNLAIITTKDCLKSIKKGAGVKEDIILFIENPFAIAAKIRSLVKPGDVILLEGRPPKGLLKELKKL